MSKTLILIFSNYYDECVEIYKYRRQNGTVEAKDIFSYVLILFEISLEINTKRLNRVERFIIIKIRKKKYIEQCLVYELNFAESMFSKMSLH